MRLPYTTSPLSFLADRGQQLFSQPNGFVLFLRWNVFFAFCFGLLWGSLYISPSSVLQVSLWESIFIPVIAILGAKKATFSGPQWNRYRTEIHLTFISITFLGTSLLGLWKVLGLVAVLEVLRFLVWLLPKTRWICIYVRTKVWEFCLWVGKGLRYLFRALMRGLRWVVQSLVKVAKGLRRFVFWLKEALLRFLYPESEKKDAA